MQREKSGQLLICQLDMKDTHTHQERKHTCPLISAAFLIGSSLSCMEGSRASRSNNGGLGKGHGKRGLEKGHGKESLQKGKGKGALEKGHDKGGLEKGHGMERLEKGKGKDSLEKGKSKGGLEKGHGRGSLKGKGSLEKGHGKGGLEKGHGKASASHRSTGRSSSISSRSRSRSPEPCPFYSRAMWYGARPARRPILEEAEDLSELEEILEEPFYRIL